MYFIDDASPLQKYQAIHGMVCRIPNGCVASYSQIADMVGLPGRARMVGKALGASFNRKEIPWWRVVRADGRIAFGADTKQGQLQQSRLLQERIVMVKMRISMRQFQWRPETL